MTSKAVKRCKAGVFVAKKKDFRGVIVLQGGERLVVIPQPAVEMSADG